MRGCVRLGLVVLWAGLLWWGAVGGLGVRCCENEACNSTCVTAGDEACFRSSLGGELEEGLNFIGCASPFTRYASVAYEVAADGALGWATTACYAPDKCNLCKAELERCLWPGTKHRSLPPLACSCTKQGMRNTGLAGMLGPRVDLGDFCRRGRCAFGELQDTVRRSPAFNRYRLGSYQQVCVLRRSSADRSEEVYGCELEPPGSATLNAPLGSRFVQYFYESWLEVRCRDADWCNDRKHFGTKKNFFGCPFVMRVNSKRCPWDPDPVKASLVQASQPLLVLAGLLLSLALPPLPS